LKAIALVKQLVIHDESYHKAKEEDQEVHVNQAYSINKEEDSAGKNDENDEIPNEPFRVSQTLKVDDDTSPQQQEETRVGVESSLDDHFNINQSTRSQKLARGFLLSCGYSSIIGGFGSLVGSPSNIILKHYLDDNYPNNNLNFINYCLFSLPIITTLLLFTWIYLVMKWLPKE
jgi:hypothetical protein